MFVWSYPRLKMIECRTSSVVLNLLFKSSKHIYYKEPLTNKEYLIMVGYSSKQTNESNTVIKIMKYHIQEDKYSCLSNITDKKIQSPFGCYVDIKHNKFYLFQTIHKNKSFNSIICDLITEKWKIIPNELIINNDDIYDNFNIGNAEFHYIHDTAHILYCDKNRLCHNILLQSKNKKEFINLNNGANNIIFKQNICPPIVYLKKLNKIMIIGCGKKLNEVWELDMNKKKDTMYESAKWKHYNNIKWPNSLIIGRYNDIVCVTGFGCIIYLFIINEKVEYGIYEIWCLDVDNNIWYRSDKQIRPDLVLSRKCFVSIGGRYCWYHGYDRFNMFKNIKIDLFDAAPKELQNTIKKRINIQNAKSVYGYIRQLEPKWNVVFPDYLKRIVLCYFNDIPN